MQPHRATSRYLTIAAHQAWIVLNWRWKLGAYRFPAFFASAFYFGKGLHWDDGFAVSHIWGWRQLRNEWLHEVMRPFEAQKRPLGLLACCRWPCSNCWGGWRGMRTWVVYSEVLLEYVSAYRFTTTIQRLGNRPSPNVRRNPPMRHSGIQRSNTRDRIHHNNTMKLGKERTG